MSAAEEDSHRAPRLAVINGLRGIAILGVIYFHLLGGYLTPPLEHAGIPVFGYLFSPYTLLANGWLGVNLFFVLSGFVLALPYELGTRKLETWGDARWFFRRRARRLLPLFYFTGLVALLFETRFAVFPPAFIAEALSVGTFAFAFQDAHFFVHFNCVLWSLGVEFWFSVAFPLLLWAFRGRRAALVTALALGVAYAVRYHVASRWGLHPVFLIPTMDGPVGRIDDFVVGMAVCRLHLWRPLRSPVAATSALLAGLVVLFIGSAAWDNVLSGRLPFVISAALNDVVLLGFALTLLGLLGGVPKLVHALFAFPVFQLAGMMCYSLYLWHLLGMHPFEDPPLSPTYTAIRLVITGALSALTYRWIEFPRRSVRELFFSFGK